MKIVILFLVLMLLGTTLIYTEETLADWTYTVRRGDTLFKIAKKTGTTVNAIKRRNGLKSNRLKIKQRIVIPTGTAAKTTRNVSRTAINYDLLARVVHAEAGAEPYLGKVAVGAVILNRVQSPKFPKTMSGVIYQPHAFESVTNGIVNRPASKESIKAARDAISGWDPSGGALYFFNPTKTNNRWIWARRIINRIGKHVFAI